MIARPDLAVRLPDIPRWIEARSMLLTGNCEILSEPTDEMACVVLNIERQLIVVTGRPSASTILQAVGATGERALVICPLEEAGHVGAVLPNRILSPAKLHLLVKQHLMPQVTSGAVRFVSKDELSGLDLPNELKKELAIVAPHCTIAATIVDELPVSFCYVGWETETLWDVSIETLREHRGLGYAARAVSFLTDHMRQRGKSPVWGAEEFNIPSMRLAAKLGFRPVDSLALFHPAAVDVYELDSFPEPATDT
jgi:GNAT superfamily N-acetyltransferase